MMTNGMSEVEYFIRFVVILVGFYGLCGLLRYSLNRIFGE